MKSFLSLLLLFLVGWLLYACEPKEDMLTTDPEAVLTFSADTVLFDTVFVARGTITKRLLVYNSNARAVRISEIRLGKAAQSPYRLIINGVEGPISTDFNLRGRDSLHILVRATIDPTDTEAPFLVTDSITFRTNGQLQDVKLVAYGQNAYFHTREEIPCNTVWKADKPHIIVDQVLVKAGCTLTIEAGARIHTLPYSFIDIDGTLSVEGTAEQRVVFAGYRLEKGYEKVPGQWNGIHLMANSRNSVIRFAEIKNAILGLWTDYSPGEPVNVRLENTIIRNMSWAGVLSLSGQVTAVNTLIANCSEHAFLAFGGGNYTFTHCTIANYFSEGIRKTPSLALSDSLTKDFGGPLTRPVRLRMENSIIWGNLKDEIVLVERGQNVPINAQLTLRNNLVKTDFYSALFALDTPQIRRNQISPEHNFPKFKAPNTGDFKLQEGSPAIGNGATILTARQDLEGRRRKLSNPDIGAYEFVEGD